MKKTKKLLMLLAVVITAIVCFAVSASAKTVPASGKCGDNVSYTYNSTTGELVISGTGPMWDYGWSNSPFYDSNIKSVVINEGVTTIGVSAFYDCDSLTKVTIGDSVTTIGGHAFYNCDSLTKVTIPDSVTTIGGIAFSGCSKLAEVTIGNSVTTIGDYAFNYCYSLTEVTIGDSVTTIGDHAFDCCDSLTDITVDENNQYFSNDEYGVLFNKDKTTLIQYQTGNKRIAYTIPDSVTTIGDWAFHRCYSLTEVTIPDSVTTIGVEAFGSCDSLTEVTIGDSVTTIGNYAFAWCDSLTEVTIPDSVTTIGVEAFGSCDSLTDVYYGGTQEQWNNISIGSYNGDLTGATIHYNYCPHTDTNSDKFCDDCGSYTEKLCESGSCGDNVTYEWYEDGMVIISGTGPMWDYDCLYFPFDSSNIKNVIISDGVTTIGDHAFAEDPIGGSSLTKVTIPDSVTTIGDKAFCDCDSLTDVYYGGTKVQWKKIKIGSYNGALTGAKIHYTCYHHINKTTHAQQNPTCTAKGYTAGTYCTDCENWLSGHEVIPATNHPKKESKPQQDATCTAKGYTAGTYCPDCKKWVSGHSTISAKGHTYTEKIIDSKHLKSKATVASPAIYKYDCADCDSISPDKTFTYGNTLALGVTSSVTAAQTASSITLTWSEAENATGYRIYYKLPGDINWRNALTYTTATKHTFENLPAGQKYRFAVQSAYKKADGSYIRGGYKEIETATKTVKPSNVTATQSTSAIKLTWSAVNGADGYKLFYKVNGKWKACVNSTTATSHTFKNLKAGAKYTFAVQPYIKTSSGVVWGEYAEYTTATLPATVTAKATSPSKGKISLSWNQVNGSEGYQIWYSKNGGSYKLYKTVGASKNAMSFSNLTSGTKYTFAVRAGIKTTGGNIFGDYKEAVVTVK